MKLYNFDLLAYPHVPIDAPRTPVPSSYFDPAKGAANYEEHLDEMTYCEELGFDGVVFNEHHYSAYGTMPSPNLIASALSQRTKKIKIGVLGNILPLRNHPVRVAEEYAMIDCLSNGRLIAGFVRGIPPEYIWYGVNPEESRGRFEEAYNLIMTAWTEPVWSHEGQIFQIARLRDLAAARATAPSADLDRRAQRGIDRMVRQAPSALRPGLPNHRSDRGHFQLLPLARLKKTAGTPNRSSSSCAATSTSTTPSKKRREFVTAGNGLFFHRLQSRLQRSDQQRRGGQAADRPPSPASVHSATSAKATASASTSRRWTTMA